LPGRREGREGGGKDEHVSTKLLEIKIEIKDKKIMGN
jgi:hypothetical protein